MELVIKLIREIMFAFSDLKEVLFDILRSYCEIGILYICILYTYSGDTRNGIDDITFSMFV